jgi:acetyl-CoA carboxylase carboxyl transferase subunit beta
MAGTGWFGRHKKHRVMESVPEGIASKCVGCERIIFARDMERNLQVCPKCGYHHRLNAQERLEITVDEESFVEMDAPLASRDPLSFPEYAGKLAKARAVSTSSEAIVTGKAAIEGHPLIIGVADFGYMGGSMGSVVGEKIARAMERGLRERLPVVMFTSSGGARMQEGLYSLMQMAKTSAAAGKLDRAGVPYIVVLTDPTTGGVYASYACLGDVILAEPGAIVGFAGRRVGNQDAGGRLPDNFQTSEFQLEHGMVDRIVPRKELRAALASLLAFFAEPSVLSRAEPSTQAAESPSEKPIRRNGKSHYGSESVEKANKAEKLGKAEVGGDAGE